MTCWQIAVSQHCIWEQTQHIGQLITISTTSQCSSIYRKLAVAILHLKSLDTDNSHLQHSMPPKSYSSTASGLDFVAFMARRFEFIENAEQGSQTAFVCRFLIFP
ncbi:hypothetical protein V6N11_055428 [Hibiscus sabdariffa]|uniref:Uncharacterized protein n=1 Tax=Hibiscus sabdariffa TaxID=183260 RepID=A0ABR2PFB3_9ROSI